LIDSPAEFEAELGARLADCTGANRVNILDVPGLRESFATTHREHASDQVEHGADPSDPYWDLVMADWSPEENAIFVLGVWRPDGLSVYTGAGDRAAIIDVCDRFTLSEVDEIVSALEVQFQISRTEVRIARALAEYWVAA
jgi:hypothetical protein